MSTSLLSKKAVKSALKNFLLPIRLFPIISIHQPKSAVLHEDHLAALYYECHEMGNKFILPGLSSIDVNNILIAFSARKYKWDVTQNMSVGNTEGVRSTGTSEPAIGLSRSDCLEQLMKISEITELVEREKKLHSLRWNWMEEATFFDYFTVERICILLQLEMIERWIALDKEKKSTLPEHYRCIENEVQIPQFR